MVDSLQGALGMTTRLTPEETKAMAAAAIFDAAAPGGALGWDPDGFVAGVEDLRGVRITGEAISDFRDSGRMRLTPADAVVLHRALGGGGDPAAFRFLTPPSAP
jgi:hypothetical protein